MKVSRAEWALMAAAALGPVLFGAVEPWSLAALLLVIGLIALGGSSREEPGARPLVSWAFAGLAALAFAQSLSRASADGPSALVPSTPDAGATARSGLMYLAMSLLAWRARAVFSIAGAANRFALFVYAAAAGLAALGIAQKSAGNASIYGLREVSPILDPFGPFYNRNHASTLLMAGAWFGGALVFERMNEARAASGAGRRADAAAKAVAAAVPLALILAGLFVVGARGAVHSLVFGAAALAVPLAFSRPRGRLLVVAACLGAAYLVLIALNPVLIGRVAGGADASASTRLEIYRGALVAWLDAPLFGHGLGAVEAAFSAYRSPAIAGFVQHLHGDWLEWLFEGGLAAAAAASLLVWAWLRGAQETLRAAVPVPAWRWAALGAVATLMAQMAFEFSMRIPGNLAFGACLFELAAGGSRPGGPKAGLPARVLGALMLAGTLVLFAGPVRAWFAHRAGAYSVAADRHPAILWLTRAAGASDGLREFGYATAALGVDPGDTNANLVMSRKLMSRGRGADADYFAERARQTIPPVLRR